MAFGAKDTQTVMAMQEAASYDGVSMVIAYAHCIAHGNDLAHGLDQQKAGGVSPATGRSIAMIRASWAPAKAHWSLDASDPNMQVSDYMASETRFRITEKLNPDHYKSMVEQANEDVRRRYHILKRMAGDVAAE